MVYALFGIPLGLVLFNSIGNRRCTYKKLIRKIEKSVGQFLQNILCKVKKTNFISFYFQIVMIRSI